MEAYYKVIEDKIFVYPNPSQEIVYVTIPVQENDHVTLQVFSMIGKMVVNKEFRSKEKVFPIDISSLSSGTYALKVVSRKKIDSKKFIYSSIVITLTSCLYTI